MKWSNKAHEFEQLQIDIMKKKIYIFGAGEYGAYFYQNIDEKKVIGFIDNSKLKQEEKYMGKRVFDLNEIPNLEQEILFVIAVSDAVIYDIRNQLLIYGVEEENIISYERYLHLYFYYRRNKLLIHHINVSVTQKCTLNCRDCSIMTTYLPEKKNYSLETLKQDVDAFFANIDYVGMFGIVGGEPFLYPELEQYLSYLVQYQERILYKIEIVTNGTIVPKDTLLELCKQYNIKISISDYTATLPYLRSNIDKLIKQLEKYQISYEVNRADWWIDFGYSYVNKTEVDDKSMIRFFDQCHMPCRLLRDGKLYYCANSAFAIDAGLNTVDKDNEMNLNQIEGKKAEAMEFDEGYNSRGYLNMCRHCNGFLGLNENYIEVARQM